MGPEKGLKLPLIYITTLQMYIFARVRRNSRLMSQSIIGANISPVIKVPMNFKKKIVFLKIVVS